MRVHWPDCHNARDLGGLRLSTGGRIRPGAVIRTDNLTRLTAEGVELVRQARVSRIIDLRSTDELASHPSPFAMDPAYAHLPFIDEVADVTRDSVAESTMLATYRGGLGRNGRCIAAAIRSLISAPIGTVVVHCAAGKDRTGVLVALLLDVVSVVREEIAADYALTADRLKERHQRELAAADPDTRDALREWQGSRPETILGTLSFVDEQYGGSVRYLTSIGITLAELALLRTRLVG